MIARTFLVLFLGATLVLSCAAGWPVSKYAQSIGMLTYANDPGTCTVTAISPSHVYLTASHCISDDQMYVDESIRVNLLYKDPAANGIAVVKAYVDAKRSFFRLGDPFNAGDEVLLLGYGGGAPFPTPGPGLAVVFAIDTPFGPISLFTGKSHPGMSGGPVLNKSGKLVSITLGELVPETGLNPTSVGVSYPRLKEVYDAYHAK